VRDYRGGLADWVEAGGPLERVATAPSAESIEPVVGPQWTVSADGIPGAGQARLVQPQSWNNSLLDLVDRLSTFQLFLIWIAMIVVSGLSYWLATRLGEHGLVEAGKAVGTDLGGLASALYFSFVTATSVGYGDVVPIGIARPIAVAEAITALLIFGAVISKFVSHRQDQLVGEIHRITFDERLDRVQSNLHVVITELLNLASVCDQPTISLPRMSTRLDSATMLFLSEARTTHDLLYQPRLMVQEGVLSSILANYAAALDVMAELLACLPAGFQRSQPFQIALTGVVKLAEDICGNCVPHEYTPRLIFWMDRIQATARKIH
jgi:hypothetical protein